MKNTMKKIWLKLITTIKLTIDITDKNMVPNWGCHYSEMVILTYAFLLKLGFNHMMWSASFNFN